MLTNVAKNFNYYALKDSLTVSMKMLKICQIVQSCVQEIICLLRTDQTVWILRL